MVEESTVREFRADMVSSSDQFLERQGAGGRIIRWLLARVKMKDSASSFKHDAACSDTTLHSL
jgi:hypothetical protein